MPAHRRPIYLTFKVPSRAKRRIDRLALEVVLKRPSLSLEEARGVVLVRAAKVQLADHRRRRGQPSGARRNKKKR